MRYVGGKVRIAKWVEEHLAPRVADATRYVEPFVGGAAILARMAPRFGDVEAGDAHEDLVLMWRAAASGWIPPEDITREQYESLRHATPSAVRGFAGYGASFSGKWFGGYVEASWNSYHGRYEKPYVSTARNSIVRDAARLGHVKFHHRPFDAWDVGHGDLVYCDPPYAGTTGYGAVGDFDHAHFWRTAESWARAGADVVVSEHAAPEGWSVLAQRERSASLRQPTNGVRAAMAERLFTFDA